MGVTASNSSANDIARLVAQAHRAWGRIDVVVNSCGSVSSGDLLSIADDDWHRGLDMVMLSIVRLARHVTPHFEAQRGGVIINVSTFAAYEPDLVYPVSSALRAALGSFAKMYSDRYGSMNIRMNNLLPGYFKTRWPEKEEVRQRIPAKRYGRPEEFAKTVAFLASDAASYIVGQNIRIDGGVTKSV